MKGFKELLEECKEFVADDPVYYGLELSTREVRLIVEALEKQVDKKGKVFFGGWLDCPNCENDISGFEERPYYCPNCGQAIDWTEELE